MVAIDKLEWDLVVATYNRAGILKQCITLAAQQSRPPRQIIVIDAGEDWRDTRDAISRTILSQHPEIGFAYQPAAEKSLTVQRNQGIGLAQSDVVFLFDDDSLMHPGCAAEIMGIYDADTTHAVAGVQANLAADPPLAIAPGETRKQSGSSELGPGGGSSALATLKRWVWRHVFLMNAGELFIPYDGVVYEWPIPDQLRHPSVERAYLFHGCRMTFRREAVLREPFEPLLRSYCPGEDLDASYRVSRHGALVTAGGAWVHHFQSASGRVNRYSVTLLSALNQAVCIRRHAADVSARRSEFRALVRRRLAAEFLKDLLSRRWTLPQLRGLLRSRRWTAAIFAMPDAELESWYVALQGDILSGKVFQNVRPITGTSSDRRECCEVVGRRGEARSGSAPRP